MSSGKEEKIPEVSKGLTIRALAIGIVLALFLDFLLIYIGPPNWNISFEQQARQYGVIWDFPTFATVYFQYIPTVFIMTLITVSLRNVLSLKRSEVVVIATMLLSSFWYCQEVNGLGILGSFNYMVGGISTYADRQPYVDLLMPYWVPQVEDFEAFRADYWALVPGRPVPWDLWLSPYGFHVVYYLLMILTYFVLGLLLTRPLVVNERLVFPNATIVSTIINDVDVSGKTLIKNKWTYIGILIGLILSLPEIIYHLAISVAPGIISITAPPQMIFDISLFGLIAWAPIVLTWTPFHLGVSFFIPTPILLTFIIGVIALTWIMPPMLSAAGYMPSWELKSWFWTQWYLNINDVHNNWYIFGEIGTGIIIAASIYTIVNHRKFFLSILKGEQKEELPYKYLLISIPILVVLYILFSAAVGAITWIIAATSLIALFMTIGQLRTLGETGFWGISAIQRFYNSPHVYTGGMIAMAYVPTELTTSNFATLYLSPCINLPTNQYMSNPSFYAIDTQQMGELTKTSKRDILIAGLIALLIVIIISPLMALWEVHHWGFYTSPHGTWFNDPEYISSWMWPFFLSPGSRWCWLMWGANPNFNVMFSIMAISTVIGLVLYYLRKKFAWFAFNPIGIYIAASYMGPLLFVPALIAYLTRRLAVRFFGAKVLTEKIFPMAIGLMFIPGLAYGLRMLIITAMAP